MRIDVLRAKLHQACITHSDVNYEGSLGIDIELMEAVGLYAYEKILVANINNGNRLETYAIPEPFGSRRMVLNGAAARLGSVGDRIIVMSFCGIEESELREGRHRPKVVRLDDRNEPIRRQPTLPTGDEIASMLEG